jgi:hypothetical protein
MKRTGASFLCLLLSTLLLIYGKTVVVTLPNSETTLEDDDLSAALTAAGASLNEVSELKPVSATADAFWNLANCQKLSAFFNSTVAPNLITLDLTGACFENNTLPNEIITGNTVFGNIGKITTVILPPNLSTVGSRSFYGCKTLEQVVWPAAAKAVNFAAFYGCNNLMLASLPATLTTIQGYAFYTCAKITVSEIPAGVKSIGSHAFRSCPQITSMIFPPGLASIEAYAFTSTPLTTVTFKGMLAPAIVYGGSNASFANVDRIDVIIPENAPMGSASPWKQSPWTAFKSISPTIPALAGAQKLAYMHYDDLIAIRNKLFDGDDTHLAACQALIKSADNLLKTTPRTVVDGDVPPTGDVHDFFTIGKYSWPNPNTPDGLPYIRIDCEVNQEAYTDRYDLDRYQKTVSYVNTLSLAWFYSMNEKYAVKAAELLRVWFLNPETKMNPNFNCAAALPGAYDGAAIGIIFAGVMIQMVDHVKLLAHSHAWTDEDDRALRQWFTELSDWLLESKFGKAEAKANNNHGSWYAAQVAGFGLYAGDTDKVMQMVALAKTQIGRQIADDGSLPRELVRPDDWGYSNYGLQAFSVMASIAQLVDEDLWNYRADNGRSLKLAWDFLSPFLAGKVWPYSNRKTVDIVPSALPYMRLAAKAYLDTAFVRITHVLTDASAANARAAWLTGIPPQENTPSSLPGANITAMEALMGKIIRIYNVHGQLLDARRLTTEMPDFSALPNGL